MKDTDRPENDGPSDGDQHPSEAPSFFDDPRLLQRLEAYSRSLETGTPGARQKFLEENPEAADELAGCLDALELVHNLFASAPTKFRGIEEGAPQTLNKPAGRVLGDFLIRTEIGRGGMGVVYEAEQLSLKRRVALKIFPTPAILAPKQVLRFQQEAAAAARLEHPNIVRVYSVGCERGVHYYAMQYIDGHSLAHVIQDLRGSVLKTGSDGSATLPNFGLSGRPPSRDDLHGPEDAPPSENTRTAPRVAPAASPSGRTTSEHVPTAAPVRIGNRQFFFSVAWVGIRAAEALGYAHHMGIIHRDVKPSNLLLDARGQLWVADFGLALDQSGSDLTMTGDIIGTARYMSPEQARSRHDLVDHRTDIYSLGVTLYELMALRPPFLAHNRHELLEQVKQGEPLPPRQLNPEIPRDLETIVLKAMASDAAARYDSAQALADDLQRFLEGKPIAARRPSLVERLARGTSLRRILQACAALVLLAILLVWLHHVPFRRAARANSASGTSAAAKPVDPLSIPGGNETRREGPPNRRWTHLPQPASSGTVTPLGLAWVVSALEQSSEAPRIAGIPSGRYVITWQDFSCEVFVSLYDAKDRRIQGSLRVTHAPQNVEPRPSVAMAEDGSFVVAWVERSDHGSNRRSGIYLQWFSQSGTPVGDPKNVDDALLAFAPSAAITPEGRVAVAYMDNDAQESGIFCRVVDRAGKGCDRFQVNQREGRRQRFPAVGALPNGELVVAWVSEHDAPAWEVQARILRPNGSAKTPEFKVARTAKGLKTRPSLAVDTSGHFLVAWFGEDTDGSGICCRAFDLAGEALWPDELVVNDQPSASQYPPDVASNGREFLVLWQSSRQGRMEAEGQMVTLDGRRVGPQFHVSQARSEMVGLRVAFAGNGRFLAAWQSSNPTSVWQVDAQRFAMERLPPQISSPRRPEIKACTTDRHDGDSSAFGPWRDWKALPPQGEGQSAPAGMHQDIRTGKIWTETLGRVPSADAGQTARARTAAIGFRLPSLSELHEMYDDHGGGRVLGIHEGLLDFYETNNPSMLGSASKDGFLQPFPRMVSGESWYLGVKTPPLDDAVYDPLRNAIFFFRGSWYQQFDLAQNRVVKTARIDDGRWTGVWPQGIDAAVYHPDKNAIYFFRGNRYQQFDLEQNQVVKEASMDDGTWNGVWTKQLDTAVYHPLRKAIYFFRGDQYQRFSLEKGKVIKEARINEGGWKGVWTSGIDAAAYHPGQKAIYFFRGNRYQRFNVELNVDCVDGKGAIDDGTWTGLE